jgi:hypothetical protein
MSDPLNVFLASKIDHAIRTFFSTIANSDGSTDRRVTQGQIHSVVCKHELR